MVIAAYLHYRLVKEEVERNVVLIFLFIHVPFLSFFLLLDLSCHSVLPTHALFALFTVLLYKKFVGEKIELKDNFCFATGAL